MKKVTRALLKKKVDREEQLNTQENHELNVQANLLFTLKQSQIIVTQMLCS